MVYRDDAGSLGGMAAGRGQPNGLTGDTPRQNPWHAAYPDRHAQGRAPSHVVFGRVNRFQWSGSGNLSVKTVFSGHSLVSTGGGAHRIEPSTYLIVNQGREYDIQIESDRPVEGLSLFFEPKLAAQAIHSFRAGAARQLDDPARVPSRNVEFFERIFAGDALERKLAKIHEELPALHSEPVWVQENLHMTMNLLLKRHTEVWKEVEEVQAVRAVTKEELYRRLYKARDYAYATLHQPVSLDDLAYVACLSTNYFLRSFRGLFQQTPHQFIIEKRMERAQSLLRESDRSVSEICLAVGFQSLGSFSWLFKRRIGVSPEAYRRTVACVR